MLPEHSANSKEPARGVSPGEAERELLHLLFEEEGIDARVSAAPAPALDGPREMVPLSSPQRRLWFLDRLQPGSDFYSVMLTFDLRGDLDVAILERCFREVVGRHSALRTRFVLSNGEPMQKIEPEAEIPLPVTDLRHLDPGDRPGRVRAILNEPEQQVFDLGRCPLLRGVLIRTEDREYILGLIVHHIVFDEWSLGILQAELSALYTACANGTRPALKQPAQYAEYTVWQREWLNGDLSEKQLEYWKKQLAGMPSVLELTTDRPRPPMPRGRDHSESRAISPRLWEDLRRVSRREGATLFMTLLAAWQVMVLRYTGQSDFGVGAPVANRNYLKAEEVIGFCVNTVVLRADLADDPAFRTALDRTKRTALEGFGHQELPLERLVEVLAPERDLSHTPLFQVMFTMRNELRASYSLDRVSMDLAGVGAATLCDLVLIASDYQGPALGLNYNADLFDAATIERMLRNYERLLEGIVADPGRRVWDLPLLSEPELNQLQAWNETYAGYPRERTLLELFEEQVERRGEETAVVLGGERLSYRELNRRAGLLGRYLQKLGAGPETLVGVSTERSIEMIVGIVGILKSGAAYVPIDPGYPPDRLKYMVADSDLRVLLTQEKLLRRMPPMDAVRLLCLDRDWREIERESGDDRPRAATAGNLLYVIYTSGSTGEPKGVAVSHRSMIRLVRNNAYLRFTGNEVMGQATNFSFDPVTFEIWGALLNGGRLVVLPQDILLDAKKFRAEIRQQGVQTMFLATALFSELAKRDPEIFATVDNLTFGGEAANVSAAAAVLEHGPPTRLVNLYGPAECTAFTSWYLAERIDKDASSVPIGRPVSNTKVYVLDREFNRLPVGVAGELYIGGEGVARGYWRHPAMTAEKFLPDPFSGMPGARCYRSGDRARFLPDGDLEFLGRVDNQIKIRGFRVELGEIEAALRQCPGVRECAVVLRQDGPLGKRLAAYVAGDSDVESLRLLMKKKLPEYMVPGSFVVLPDLPVNTNGKVDRKALLDRQDSGGATGDVFVAPRNPIEVRAAAIWAEVLGVMQVGIHDNFFRLGGHSLLATSMIARVQQEFGVDPGVKSLFESPTVAQQAELIAARLPLVAERNGAGESKHREARPGHRPVVFPLSSAQERLWFFDRLQPGSHYYNVPMALELSGDLDVELLRRSLRRIVLRHETLRTSFFMEDGEPRQRIHSEPDELTELGLPLIDLSALSEKEKSRESARILAEESARSFDLGRGPLLTCVLMRLGPCAHILSLTMHHIVCDEWSVGVLWREMGLFYESLKRNSEDSPLPDLPMQYADYALLQREWLRGECFSRRLDYWKTQLAGMPGILDLATDFPRPTIQSFRGAVEARPLPVALWRALGEFARREHVTPFMLLLAVFQVLLLRYSGQEDFCVGTAVANRNRVEEEGLIGFFVNTLVLRACLSGRPNFLEVLRRAREMSLGAYGHQELPFEKLVEELMPDRDVSRSPVFQVMFTLRNGQADDFEFGELRARSAILELTTSKCDLVMSAEEYGEYGNLLLNYNTDLFSRATARRMMEHFERLLESVLADTGCPVLALPMLTPEEENQLIAWNRTKVPLPAKTVVDLFEKQVANRRDNLAVAAGDVTLSYSELDRRASRLARRLRTLLPASEAVVGLCMDRSPDLIISMLAVMKAGGAWLPLNPACPGERLHSVVLEAGAAVVLTTASRRGCLPREMEAKVVSIDRVAEIVDGRSFADLPPVNLPESLAFIHPDAGRLIMTQHRSLVNLVTWQMQTHHIGPDDRVSQVAAPGSPAFASEVWACLTSGASLHIANDGVSASPAQLSAWLSEQRITVSSLPSSLASEMPAADAVPAALRLLLSVGDPLNAVPKDLAFAVVSGYSLPGCVGMAAAAVIEPGVQASETVPAIIGAPIANTEVRILDLDLSRISVGVPGDLWLAGVGLARGFLNRADLTALYFRPDPFAMEPGGRMVCADHVRARYREDGGIELVSPAETQAFIEGVVVQFDEVEALLEQHQSVKQAVVTVQAEREGNRRLAAYVVAGGRFDSGEARLYLERALPSSMVPEMFITLPALPLTPSGRIDRRALAGLGEKQASDQPAPPRTELEQTIAAAWRELLGLDKISVHDNFFDSGGHSLMIIRLHEKLCSSLALEIELMHLFQFPTIDSLSRFLQAGYNFKGRSRGLVERAGRQKNAIQGFRRMQTV